MKKRNYIVLILIGVIAASAYFYNAQRKIKKLQAQIDHKMAEGDQSTSGNLINTPMSIKTNSPTPNKVKKVYETKDEKFDSFEKTENAWLQKIETVIGASQFPLYIDMRNRNEKEKEKAYQAYHDYLRAKYGNNFKYNISEDQSINEKKINERYLKELLTLIGEEKYKNYLKAKDEFNEKLHRESKGKSFLIIEF